ncbi:MAG: phospholipase D-like domain-containing protein, partial [Candidatus Sericytochromatia bacterium]
PTYELSAGHEEASWHDLLYTVRGNETGRIIDEFFKNWVRAGGKKPAQTPVVIPALGGSARVESVLTNPHTGFQGLREAHSKAIKAATKEIVAIYPYFSDDQLVKELIAAKQAKPGLSIKVIMPANKEASHEGSLYSALNKETARQLLEAGIEVRMFDGGDVQRFSHLKAMLFDNQLLSIGSANGDARTYNANHELNTLIQDPKAVSEFRAKIVKPDWAASQPVTLAELKGQSLWDKLKQKVLEALDFLL